jgi:hypothetical protein
MNERSASVDEYYAYGATAREPQRASVFLTGNVK